MAKARGKVIPKRGDMYLVSFDPAVGAEIKKTRPALILQNDIGNRYSGATIVAAVTSSVNEKLYPTEVLVEATKTGLKNDSVVLLSQIRTIDKRRLIKKIGSVEKETMELVHRAIEISLGLFDL